MYSQSDDASGTTWHRWIMPIASTLVTLVLCGLLFFLMPVADRLAVELGPVGPVVLVALHTSTVVIVPLPAWPITAVNAVVYSAWAGFGLSMAGTVLGSVGIFLLGRRFGERLVFRFTLLSRYSGTVRGSDGYWLVPLLTLPIPMGGDIGCLLAGLTRISFWRFLFLTTVGRIPGNALGTLGAVGVATGSATIAVTAAAGIMLLMLLARRWRAKRAQRADVADMPAEGALDRTSVREAEPVEPADNEWVDALPRPVAFVFGAGGSHGAVQVGQLRALREHGISPDLLVGCSVGALNAALIAADPEQSARRLDILWRQVGANDLFCRSGDPLSKRRAMFTNDGLRRLAEQHFSTSHTFDDLAVPLHLLAGTGITLRKQILSTGQLLPALLASCALPLLLPSVTIDGVRLVDGGLRHALPVAEALELGAASVIALPTTRWPRPIGYRASAPLNEQRITTLDGSRPPGTGWTFSRTSALIENGYRATKDQLAEWGEQQRADGPRMVRP